MKERYGTVYKGSQRLIDEESGEVIEVDKLYRKQTSGNFVKAYIVQLISMLDMIGGKKLKIVNYILDGSVAKLKLYAHLYKTIKANIVLTVKSFVSINYFSFFSINIT